MHYQFTLSPATLKAPGIRNVAGVVFGALAACANQTHWPLVGTAVANAKVVVLERSQSPACGGSGQLLQHPRSADGGMMLSAS